MSNINDLIDKACGYDPAELELKPCPFCGGDDLVREIVQETGYTVTTVVCQSCCAMCEEEQWNKRKAREVRGDLQELR